MISLLRFIYLRPIVSSINSAQPKAPFPLEGYFADLETMIARYGIEASRVMRDLEETQSHLSDLIAVRDESNQLATLGNIPSSRLESHLSDSPPLEIRLQVSMLLRSFRRSFMQI